MPGRKYYNNSIRYRYSFNGQEKEIDLNENITTAKYWEYDSRIGRRWNVDPKSTTGVSDFSGFLNNPILNMDPLGDSVPPRQGMKPQVLEGNRVFAKSIPSKTPGSGAIKFGVGVFNFLLKTLDETTQAPMEVHKGNVVVKDVIASPLILSYNSINGIAKDPRNPTAWGENFLPIFSFAAFSSSGTFTRVQGSDLRAYGGTRRINVKGGDLNCAGCAIAGNATLNSYPATAIKHGVTTTVAVAKDLNGTWLTGMNMSSVSATMSNLGDGATGVVFGARLNQTGHFFNVVNKGGKIQFLDFQKAGSAVMQTSDITKFYELWFLNGTLNK